MALIALQKDDTDYKGMYKVIFGGHTWWQVMLLNFQLG